MLNYRAAGIGCSRKGGFIDNTVVSLPKHIPRHSPSQTPKQRT